MMIVKDRWFIREFPYTGKQFIGLLTDVQFFSRWIEPEEAIDYTTCAKVTRFQLSISLLDIK